MNVVFWSCMPGLAHVSSSLLATALASAVDYHLRCSVMQLQLQNNSLIPSVVLPGDSNNLAYFENIGIDALIRVARGGSCSVEDVEGTTFSFVKRNLNVVVESRQRSEEVYQNDLLPQLPQIFRLLQNTFRLNFIDVPAGANAYSRLALEHADIIVVCLPQVKWVIDYFFEKYQFHKEKVFFMFGDYDSALSINVRSAMWGHPSIVKNRNCAIIPHSSDFANAMNNSKTISYYMQNTQCKAEDPNYNFIKMSREAAGKIIKMCGIEKE